MKTDKQLKNDVMDELEWSPAVTSSDIQVTAQDGVVTLRGTVPHYAEKAAAERAVQRVTGVKAIAEEITVSLDGIFTRDDTDIAQSVVSSLGWHVLVPKNVQATVEHGWVTLSGNAQWDYQRSAASDAVRHLFGVKGVSNDIVLHPSVKPSAVKDTIEKAFKRDAELDAKNIFVSIDDAKVTLTGTVNTWDQRVEAGQAAWNTAGVTAVANDLVIAY